MTNSWAMLYDAMYGSSDEEMAPLSAAKDDTIIPSPYNSGFENMSLEEYAIPSEFDFPIADANGVIINETDTVEYKEYNEVVITEDPITPASGKDVTFWKYNEGKILREVEEYLGSTYKGHYVGGDNKIQTLDLIDSNGDAEAFCRANIIKYASRFGKKDGKNPKDLLKVIHYAFLLYHFADLPFSESPERDTHSPMGR